MGTLPYSARTLGATAVEECESSRLATGSERTSRFAATTSDVVARHDVAAVSIGPLLRVTIVRRRSASTPAKHIKNAKHTILTFILSSLTFTVPSSILSLTPVAPPACPGQPPLSL